MKRKHYYLNPILGFAVLMFTLVAGVSAQNSGTVILDELSHFKSPPGNWQLAGGVTASLERENVISVQKGDGILVNNPQQMHGGKDLYTRLSHGDIDLELDYMMPRGSNSGIYLQGRYEIQLHDSWTVKVPSSGNNGGIYERPSDVKGSRQGYAPRQNVSRAPGLWQHLELSFRAPRFNSEGEKVENAQLLRAELNGVVIHEGVELIGPTAGAIGEGEVARGPLRFQGDHGPVAFRNIRITRYNRSAPSLHELEYDIYEGVFTEEPDLDTLTSVKNGSSESITPYLGGMPDQYLLRYKGIIKNDEPGNYTFTLHVAGGAGLLRIDGIEIVGIDASEGSIDLPKGTTPFELFYARRSDWNKPGINLSVSAERLRRHSLSDRRYFGQNGQNPIYIHANEKPLLRSFRDLPGGDRLTHAISVSSPDKVHYTYDMNHGSLVQVWRGKFLNVTPMWYSRGDGSSRPNGSVENLLDKSALAFNILETKQAAWKTDTTGTGYSSAGYTLDDSDNPTFRYTVFGTRIQDKIRAVREGGGFRRTISLDNVADALHMRLATGKSIKKLGDNLYLIDDQSYYIQFDEFTGGSPFIRTVEGQQELIIPAQSNINYTILF